MRSFPIKENSISLVVIEILSCRQKTLVLYIIGLFVIFFFEVQLLQYKINDILALSIRLQLKMSLSGSNGRIACLTFLAKAIKIRGGGGGGEFT